MHNKYNSSFPPASIEEDTTDVMSEDAIKEALKNGVVEDFCDSRDTIPDV